MFFDRTDIPWAQPWYVLSLTLCKFFNLLQVVCYTVRHMLYDSSSLQQDRPHSCLIMRSSIPYACMQNPETSNPVYPPPLSARGKTSSLLDVYEKLQFVHHRGCRRLCYDGRALSFVSLGGRTKPIGHCSSKRRHFPFDTHLLQVRTFPTSYELWITCSKRQKWSRAVCCMYEQSWYILPFCNHNFLPHPFSKTYLPHLDFGQ
jgi:hypothetical protein